MGFQCFPAYGYHVGWQIIKKEIKKEKKKKSVMLCNVQHGHAAAHVKINGTHNGCLVISMI